MHFLWLRCDTEAGAQPGGGGQPGDAAPHAVPRAQILPVGPDRVKETAASSSPYSRVSYGIVLYTHYCKKGEFRKKYKIPWSVWSHF